MPEYQIHILNWPIEADSPEEAAREATERIKRNPTGFLFCVTSEDVIVYGDRFDSREFEETAIGEATRY